MWKAIPFLMILFLPVNRVKAARLIVKLRQEFRESFFAENSPHMKQWQSLGLKIPQRCFPKHQPMYFPKGEQAFGPTDLSLLYHTEVPESLKTDFFLKLVKKMPGIFYAEWAREVALPLSFPNDPSADSIAGFQRQVLKKIRAYEGWSISRGDSNVVIGILDTGTPVNHEDINGNLSRNENDPVNGLDDDGNGLVDDYNGWDFGSNDNNPTPDNTGTSPGHGTSVSSLSSARTDNALGIAGIGWKCRMLPVKIWNWNGSFSNFSGYEAIVYAADMGCKVINCSWGSPGSGSQYEQDIIRYASFNKGALVVAAGGNTAGYYQFLPANYDYAFGVSMTDTSDRIFWAASRHFKLDLMAPGVGIYGIKTNGSYGWVEGGTSMASPMVAGAAGLILAKFPQLNGLQAGELLRVNSDTVYSLPGNAGYRDQTGRGRLNIQKALQRENRISLRAVQCIPQGLARPGDTLRIALRFENYLDSVSAFNVKLYSGSPNLTMLENVAVFGPLGSMKDIQSGSVFTALVQPSVSGRTEISLRADVSSGAYSDRRWFTIQLNPDWLDLDSNDVRISIAENGRIGFSDLAGYLGSGIRYRGIQLSSDAGLMMGTGPGKVADCVFAGPSNNLNFRAENRPRYEDFPQLDQHAVFHFSDSSAGAQTSGLGIKQSAFESTDDSLSAAVFISYQVTNRNNTMLDSLCIGMYNDWETGNPEKNYCSWMDSLQILYTHPADGGKIAATMLLGPGDPQIFAIDAIQDTAGSNINLYDGFSKAEKWKTLNSGTSLKASAGGTAGRNVVQVCGMKWRQLGPGETRKMAFAFLFADSITQLVERARTCRSFFQGLNTSPDPVVTNQDFCDGDSLQTSWTGAKKLAVFSDSLALEPVFEGYGFNPLIYSDTSWFVSGRDSLFPGPLTKIQFRKKPLPEAFLTCTNCPAGDSVNLGSSISFVLSGSPGRKYWYLNGQLIPDSLSECCKTFSADQEGTLTICAEIEDSLDACKKRVCRELSVVNVTRVINRDATGLSLFPNPVADYLQIVSDESSAFSLYDLLGREIFTEHLNPGLNLFRFAEILKGSYIWKIQNSDKKLFGRLQKE